MVDKILQINNLSLGFDFDFNFSKVIFDVNFDLYKNETLGIVGESGSGKTVTSLSILRLIPEPPGKIVSGEVIYNGNNLLNISINKLRHIRGKEISMIFQDPMTALNPILTIKTQMNEVLFRHFSLSEKEATKKSIDMLLKLGIKDAARRINDYPFNFSGGMLQRVMIGISLITNPKILILDEPTTALDVTIQSQILELLTEIKKTYNLSMIFISHDLAVVSKMSDRIIVMYAGRIQEVAKKEDLFKNPLHPYSKALIECIPKINQEKGKLKVIDGQIPSSISSLKGCSFAPRCEYAKKRCFEESPKENNISGRIVRCFYPLI